MKVSVYGLGYVGTVTSACLATLGHHVLGVDINAAKVEAIREGRSPIVEAEVGDMLATARGNQLLDATLDQAEAARKSDVSILCIGTPTGTRGGPDLTHLFGAAHLIAIARRDLPGYHTVAIRSTVPPGTVAEMHSRMSDELPADRFGVAANPEFLREGTAVADFLAPPFTIIGTEDDRAASVLTDLYSGIEAPLHRTSVGVAELMKYACNSYHALKVAFANEIGTACRHVGVDGQELMKLFCQDTTLNVSAAYLRPGSAYGGSCLPKDVRALEYLLRHADVEAPLAKAIEKSNHEHVQRIVDLILDGRPRRVTLLGLAFKSGTDDVRESPPVRVAERLIGSGIALRIHDSSVRYAALLGANRAHLDQEIPHITELLAEDPADAVRDAQAVLISAWHDDFGPVLAGLEGRPRVIDTVGIPAEHRTGPFDYVGICW